MKRSMRLASLGVVAAAMLLTTAACSSSEPASTTTSAEASGNVVDVAVSAGSFTVLVKLLNAAGLEETLSGPGPFTVFAPTDAAFEVVAADLGISLDDLVNTVTAEPALLTDILLYHVVTGKIPAADVVGLNGTKVETLSGESWTVIVDGETVSIEDGYGEIANVIDVDVKASNGVIHVVDGVIQGAVPGE